MRRGMQSSSVRPLPQNFPAQNGLFTDPGAPLNVFVTKVNPSAPVGGASIVWSTYLGGSKYATQGYGVAADSSGSIYATGVTVAPDFPLKNPFQSSFNTATNCATVQGSQVLCSMAFVTKLLSSGNQI